ncbi:MAG TPA: hypothetical protein VK034_18005, partial [Enhygromyxa sp.]|nr:hypothetical protein [Enhygromyxa sp.]
ELRSLGVEREQVDRLFERGLALARERKTLLSGPEVDLTAHDVSFAGLEPGFDAHDDRSVIIEVAAWLLYHQQDPGYAAMMYIRIGYWSAIETSEDALIDWFVRQLASMLVGDDDDVAESARYALNVDYYEHHQAARLVVPRLLAVLPERQRDEFLADSWPVVWSAKQAFYRSLIDRPEMHDELALALRGSIYASGSFGTVDARAAWDIVERITISDPTIARDLELGLRSPIRARIVSVVALDPSERRHPWCRGDWRLALALDPPAEQPSLAYRYLPWFSGSELWADGRRWGVVVGPRCSLDHDRPFQHSPPPHTRRDLEGEASGRDAIEWHELDGDAEPLWPLLGRMVEFRAPGMPDAR